MLAGFARFFIRFGVALALCVAALGAGPSHAKAPREAGLVMDAKTGEILYAKNADAESYPASLTKMMTLYLTFEALEAGRLKLDQPLPVSAHAAAQAPTKLGLKPGQSVTVEQAILALVVKSANDVASVVAEALGGTEKHFAELMTAKARALGMASTTFRNASGLPDKRQVSTARDMARLAIALYREFPQYYHYFGTQRFDFNGQTIYSHNRMLRNYPGTDGLKTGYTAASGFNIAVSARRGGRHLIGVVFGGTSAGARDRKMAKLLDQSFAQLESRERFAANDATPETKPVAFDAAGSGAAVQFAVAEREVAVVWGIQVGAYSSAESAANALQTATSTAGEVLDSAGVALTPIARDGATLYRARFLGLTEAEAEEACRALKRGDLPCAIVRQTEETTRFAAGS